MTNTGPLAGHLKPEDVHPTEANPWLVQEFARRELPHQVSVLSCGHYSSGMAPFKFVDGYLLTNFLVRNL